MPSSLLCCTCGGAAAAVELAAAGVIPGLFLERAIMTLGLTSAILLYLSLLGRCLWSLGMLWKVRIEKDTHTHENNQF
jgi:hypothetical protein